VKYENSRIIRPYFSTIKLKEKKPDHLSDRAQCSAALVQRFTFIHTLADHTKKAGAKSIWV
jgi:hypothetical protein